MRLSIVEEDGHITTFKQFDDFKGRGEIAHFIAELEIAKMELLELWDDAEAE